MENRLDIYSTTAIYGNVAIGKEFSDPLELHEMILAKLAQGIAIFIFEKADGTIRRAIGTLHPHLMRSGSNAAFEVMEKTIANMYAATKMFEAGKKNNKVIIKDWEQVEEQAKMIHEAYKEKKEAGAKKTRKLNAQQQPFFCLEEMKMKSYNTERVLALINL